MNINVSKDKKNVIRKYFNRYFWCDIKSIYNFFDNNKKVFFIKTNSIITCKLKYYLNIFYKK